MKNKIAFVDAFGVLEYLIDETNTKADFKILKYLQDNYDDFYLLYAIRNLANISLGQEIKDRLEKIGLPTTKLLLIPDTYAVRHVSKENTFMSTTNETSIALSITGLLKSLLTPEYRPQLDFISSNKRLINGCNRLQDLRLVVALSTKEVLKFNGIHISELYEKIYEEDLNNG